PRGRLAAERDVVVENARGEDDRAVPAETFVDGGREEPGLGPEPGELVGMQAERAHAVADQPDRRLEAGDQEPDRLRGQLGGTEAVARLLGADERAQEVVRER